MKVQKSIIIFLFFSSSILFGQTFKLENISLTILPDISIVDKALLGDNAKPIEQFTIGYGMGIELDATIKNKFYLASGLNLANRRFGSIGYLNQSRLPEDSRSFTQELVTIKTLTYPLVEIPLKAGFVWLAKEKIRCIGYLGGTASFILAGNYKNSFDRYDGSYKKEDMKAFSALLGMQSTYAINEKWRWLYGLEYSFYNTIDRDEYIDNNRIDGIAVDHKFIRFTLGVQRVL